MGYNKIKVSPFIDAIWKTIDGTVPRDRFRSIFSGRGINAGPTTAEIVRRGNFIVASRKERINFGRITPGELGFRGINAGYSDICRRIKRAGGELCRPEDAAQLRVQYLDQPQGESLVMAMKPIRVFDGEWYVFLVKHNNSGLWLTVDYSSPDDRWPLDTQFICRRPIRNI